MREFRPLEDLHVGAITTSLGGSGAVLDCLEEPKFDRAHLLGSLPRAGAAEDFLSWSGDLEQATTLIADFQSLVNVAGELGCGWEASLESWYRFLVEPAPWTKVVRQNCNFGGDVNQSCVGPETDDQGVPLVDTVLLEQRRQFLRPDSLLAVVMLSDENDCSFKASGQSWRLSQTGAPVPGDPTGAAVPNRAFKGTQVCATDPNSSCCHSCGASPPAGCATATNAQGQTVGEGCEEPRYPSTDDLGASPTEDAINLRCFEQKRRFGVDYLYPVERYSNALTLAELCPTVDTLDPALCSAAERVPNTLFTDFSYAARLAEDPAATPIAPRGSNEVFLVGVLGVPWQDLAVDISAPELRYRSNRASAAMAERVDWSLLLGTGDQPPGDPLMIEQIEPRVGTHPITGEAIAPPESPELANAINGHEWNSMDRDDLQYVCIFPLPAPVTCAAVIGTGPNCDCSYYGDAAYSNPLCQNGDVYGLEQRYAGAYPALRQLRVLQAVGDKAIVTSICPRETQISDSPDFGYRPLVRAMVDGMRGQLELR